MFSPDFYRSNCVVERYILKCQSSRFNLNFKRQLLCSFTCWVKFYHIFFFSRFIGTAWIQVKPISACRLYKGFHDLFPVGTAESLWWDLYGFDPTFHGRVHLVGDRGWMPNSQSQPVTPPFHPASGYRGTTRLIGVGVWRNLSLLNEKEAKSLVISALFLQRSGFFIQHFNSLVSLIVLISFLDFLEVRSQLPSVKSSNRFWTALKPINFISVFQPHKLVLQITIAEDDLGSSSKKKNL